jgi:hypothetical protein
MSPKVKPVRQWHQLDMWKTAKELRNAPLIDVEATKIWRKDEGISHEDMDKEVMGQKLDESRASGLYNSIKASGVTHPVYLSDRGRFASADLGPGFAVSDGHHRIASAHDIDPNMLVPVEYNER